MEIPKYDVVVVGGGAAGLSAALVLGRARRRVAVIEAAAPRNALAAHMQGFLSCDGMLPADLLTVGRGEVTGYGVELVEDQVVAIEPGFVVGARGLLRLPEDRLSGHPRGQQPGRRADYRLRDRRDPPRAEIGPVND